MSFPLGEILVILVLPSMMIMVMGPAFLRLSNSGL